jgi:hypothetical protein
MLSACASFPQAGQFNQSVNNTVQDVNIAATGAVSIVTDVLKALLSIGQPIMSVLNAVGVNP